MTTKIKQAHAGMAFPTGPTGPGILPTGLITGFFDGAGSVLATGAKSAFVSVPYDCTVVKWRMLADVAGAAVVDIWKDTFANFPPVNADSIVASAKPTIGATNAKAESSTLTGWTINLSAGDVVEYEIESCTTITRLSVALFVIGR